MQVISTGGKQVVFSEGYMLPVGATAQSIEADADRAEAAADRVENLAPINVPSDISGRSFEPSSPSINVLGYPTSPGASNDWVRSQSIPAHGIYEIDLNSQVWVPSEFTVRAEHFGAMVRGARADEAINNAVAFSVANGRGKVVIPPGRFVIEDTIYADLAQDKKISICGSGSDVTILEMDGLSTSRAINLPAPASRIAFAHISDFSVEVNGQIPAGTAIAATMEPGGVQDRISLFMERLRVYGKDISRDYIGTMFDVTGHWRPRLIDLFGTGCWGPGIDAPNGIYANDSPLFSSNIGVKFDGCYSPYLQRCRMSSTKTGYQSIGTAEEAYYLRDCIANQVRIGLHIQRTNPEPLGFIDNFYASYRDKGIHINGGKLLRITSPYLDQVDPGNNSVSAPVDVLLENVTDVRVAGGVHNYAGDTRRIAYQVFAAVRAQRIDIEDYSLSGTFTTGVLVGAGAQGITVKPGAKTGTVGTEIQNGAGSLNLTVVRNRPLSTRLARITSPISSASGAWTPVAWNAEVSDSAEAWTSGANIVVPSGRGVSTAKVVSRAAFSPGGTGIRGIRVLLNGALPAFSAEDFEAAHVGMNSVSATTGEISVAEGDVLTVEVYQTSGGAMDILTGQGTTWVEVTFS